MFLACDKDNKKGISYLVKYLAYWDHKINRVHVYLLDCEASEGTSTACAYAINFSLTRIDAEDLFIQLYGKNKYAGGGVMSIGLAKESDKIDRTIDMNSYLPPTFCLHGHQILLSNPIKNLMGEGGLGKIFTLQLLHCMGEVHLK